MNIHLLIYVCRHRSTREGAKILGCHFINADGIARISLDSPSGKQAKYEQQTPSVKWVTNSRRVNNFVVDRKRKRDHKSPDVIEGAGLKLPAWLGFAALAGNVQSRLLKTICSLRYNSYRAEIHSKGYPRLSMIITLGAYSSRKVESRANLNDALLPVLKHGNSRRGLPPCSAIIWQRVYRLTELLRPVR